MSERWEAIESGNEPEPMTYGPITRTDFVRYQGASGDMNPVHHDEPFARAAGFDGPLGIGMFPAGAMFSWATAWLGPANVRRVRARWKAPVFAGDTLSFSGTVAKKYEENGERRVDLDLVCTKADGSVAVQGWATFVVP
jgi:acyl dehydratase